MFLYKITNRLNGKCYIGITKRTVRYRYGRHRANCADRTKVSYLYAAMRRDGIENFEVETLAKTATWKELVAMEVAAIAEHNAFWRDGGYNLTRGGEGVIGLVLSEEARQAAHAAWKGRKHTPEALAKIAEASRNWVRTDEVKRKIGAGNSGKKRTREELERRTATRKANGWYSPEGLAKVSAAKKGNRHRAKPICVDGVVYPSRADAQAALVRSNAWLRARLDDGRAYYLRDAKAVPPELAVQLPG